jgi:hypothetical protein
MTRSLQHHRQLAFVSFGNLWQSGFDLDAISDLPMASIELLTGKRQGVACNEKSWMTMIERYEALRWKEARAENKLVEMVARCPFA